jgi:hypothetical protein
MHDDELLTSITWHYLVGNEQLTASQLAEHEKHYGCPACDGKSPAAAAQVRALANGQVPHA